MHKALALQPTLPLQTPAAQTSLPVQPLKSLHGAVLLVNWHPLVGSQLSSVQGLPSVQEMAAPGLQVPATQASFPVQTFPSVQMALLAVWLHRPVAALQASSVQTFASSQLTAVPGEHAPPLHLSPAVQPLLSEQLAVLLVWVQPATLSQESLVQGLPSSQLIAPPAPQEPPLQVSPTVQTLPSLQDAVLLADLQPAWASQVSVVQGLPSSQVLGPAGVQTPALQASPMVQLLLSLQTAVLLVCWQPFEMSQESSVHGLPSSQIAAVPGVQMPPAQVSPRVQTSLSEQGAVLLLC